LWSGVEDKEEPMTNVTTQSKMFVPRRRRIGGGGTMIGIVQPTTNPDPDPVCHVQGVEASVLVHYPKPESEAQPANFAFWSITGSADGEYTVRPKNPEKGIDVNLDPAKNMTATAWYMFAGGSGNGGPSELETDAFLVDREEFVEPTPIESVTPTAAWDPSDVREFVFTAEPSKVEALDSVVDPSESFEQWYSIEGEAEPGPGRDLNVPKGDSGIAVATYRIPQPTHVTPSREPGLVGTLVGGVAFDGEGGIIVGGHYHPVEPWGPFLGALAVFNAAKALQPEARAAVQIEAMRAIAGEAKRVEQQLRGGGEAGG
jgi:hypothetical protein